MKQRIIQGKPGITRIEGRYELVAKSAAEKFSSKKHVVIFSYEQKIVNENVPYAEHQIPDGLMW